MADLTDTQSAQAVKIIGSNSSGVETNPVNSTSDGALHSNLRSGTTELIGQQDKTLSIPVVIASDQDRVTEQAFYLLNGSSKTMNVDGSVTPVVFSFTPSSGIYKVTSVTFFMADTGSLAYANFGALSSLTNGLLIEVKTNGLTNTFFNLQDNIDIGMAFNDSLAISSTVNTGFLNDNDFFNGSNNFDVGLHLDASQGDFFRVTVRDDLTGLTHLRMLVMVRKEV